MGSTRSPRLWCESICTTPWRSRAPDRARSWSRASKTPSCGAHSRRSRRQAADPCGWKVTIDKHIPVAAGLGGGSSDAGTALRLANDLLDRPLARRQLHALAADLGSDVPFFLEDGPQLATGDGSELEPIAIPLDFWVVLVLPVGVTKTSTADVYRAFDARARRRRLRPASCCARASAARGTSRLGPCRTAAQRPPELARHRRPRATRRAARGRHGSGARGLRAVRGSRRGGACCT